mmetsp:Transcript_23667/g.35206  ORF Transcript_23667/g.35206 Transcript_23667/m.35206 type:complete len:1045 (+) Transcript_23667:220-3354(+)|eukprot:CAMPEP_0203670880 /NCGR_PEP_ID=MMETSP0090-20130426/6842_1 /ASSEMBLY_ACC=CAM_ASM_001088 /TAXON_ID=426623 /ORGANISM="Chaetoceros affinis, Strain CCMP159" /LENGTH=1044 /DNA_ID=CAMNT_0050535853 /DNA_START=210 /DNA_END=3344 /DNA_ORIENTATION=-
MDRRRNQVQVDDIATSPKSKGIINQFDFHKKNGIRNGNRNGISNNNNSNGYSNGPPENIRKDSDETQTSLQLQLNRVITSDSSDYTLATYDIANQRQKGVGKDKGKDKDKPTPQTGDVDVIGILNNSVSSLTTSQIFKQSTKTLATTTANNKGGTSAMASSSSSRFRPPPSPKFNNRNRGGGANVNKMAQVPLQPLPPTMMQQPKPQQMHHISYHDMSTSEFPTIEVKIEQSFPLRDGHSDPSSNMNSNGNDNNYSNNNEKVNSDKNGRSMNMPMSMNINVNMDMNMNMNTSRTTTPPPTPPIGGADVDAPPVSPLTPTKAEEEESKINNNNNMSDNNRHRRMSSSERLFKMLDEMNKKKPFDFRDDDEDDYYDDEEDEEGNGNPNANAGQRGNRNGSSGGRSGKSSNTTPTRNSSYQNIKGRGLYAGSSTGGGNDNGGGSSGAGNNSASSIFTPSSALSSSYKNGSAGYSSIQRPSTMKRSSSRKNSDPTLYAQSFVLSLAFFAVWSPQNLMAPNLTQMAEYFHFTPDQRDLYLGANIALATGVLSLPVSAMLGFLADMVGSRIKLFAGTVCCGGISAILTGLSVTYTQVYFARFCCGGCMAGSVVIAFSILGDLFDAKDRNAASSGLTAMMGSGILLGQVFAGTVGDKYGWKVPFYVSGITSIVTSMMVVLFVSEPVRGGKEKVLQDMIANGTKYDRKLTLNGFIHAMTKNKTNVILMLQGLFTNVPWGIIFTFLNDYLSQEQGLSVPASTFLVLWFGIGSALGGVYGGFCGAWCVRRKRSLLPLFMAVTTFAGIVPFLGLLDLKLNGPSLFAVFLGLSGGCVANLPSVNVRPCILNVNPPETRGAAMTANNLMVNVARGAGPSLITLSQSFFGVSRQYSFNVTLITFWSITTLLLLILVKTLPDDQDAMEAELASYAKSKVQKANTTNLQFSLSEKYKELDSAIFDDSERFRMLDDNMTQAGGESIVSIEDRMTSFDAAAAQESWTFIEEALREIAELSNMRSPRGNYEGLEVWDSVLFDGDSADNEERGRRDNLGNFETI